MLSPLMNTDRHRTARDPLPIWLAVLLAAQCRATGGNRGHAVSWVRELDRAMYTNDGTTDEVIEPLGVSLEHGQTLAVSWRPGETAYTIEVYGQKRMCAWAPDPCGDASTRPDSLRKMTRQGFGLR
jgi:hypothetical protein